MEDKVILVDRNDKKIGLDGKMSAHRKGHLHRAISIFVFNRKGETMLQQRALTKYHSKGLWTNTCCSHPLDGETILHAAHRKLKQEMGFDCKMRESFSFIYKEKVGSGLTEHEFDHVLFGVYDRPPKLNPEEAKDWKWMSMKELRKDAKAHPRRYTAWLKVLLNNEKLGKMAGDSL